MNVYEINENIVKELGERRVKEYKQDFLTIFIITGMTTEITKIIDMIFNNINLSYKLNSIFVYMLPIITLIYFFTSRYLKRKKLIKLLDKNGTEKKIKF